MERAKAGRVKERVRRKSDVFEGMCAAYVQFWMIAIGAANPAGRSAASHWHLRRRRERGLSVVCAWRANGAREVGGWSV